jgi:hypothetical protein
MTDIPFEQWIKALRSGDYKQTRGTLKGELPDGGTGYCCLGVLAEIMGYEVEKQGIIEGSLSGYSSEGPLSIYEHLRDVIGWDYIDTLIHYNDETDLDFKEIADYIERKILTDG